MKGVVFLGDRKLELLQFRKRTRSRYENDADDQNSRHRHHQSRF